MSEIICNLCGYICESYNGLYCCEDPDCNNEEVTDGNDKNMDFYFIKGKW